jgi:hypothetical protein
MGEHTARILSAMQKRFTRHTSTYSNNDYRNCSAFIMRLLLILVLEYVNVTAIDRAVAFTPYSNDTLPVTSVYRLLALYT